MFAVLFLFGFVLIYTLSGKFCFESHCFFKDLHIFHVLMEAWEGRKMGKWAVTYPCWDCSVTVVREQLPLLSSHLSREAGRSGQPRWGRWTGRVGKQKERFLEKEWKIQLQHFVIYFKEGDLLYQNKSNKVTLRIIVFKNFEKKQKKLLNIINLGQYSFPN